MTWGDYDGRLYDWTESTQNACISSDAEEQEAYTSGFMSDADYKHLCHEDRVQHSKAIA